MKYKRSLVSITMATLVLASLCAVASVGANAAAGGPGPLSVNVAKGGLPTQASGALVGNPVQSGPGVCVLPNGNVDLFVKGYDGALWWYGSDTGSVWTSLGGGLSADPAAVAINDTHIIVFVRGNSGSLWYKETTDTGVNWSDWYSLGGKLLDGTGPAVYAWGNGSGASDQIPGVLVTGTDYGLWHLYFDRYGNPTDWQPLGGYLTSSPAAAAPAYGVVHVYARGQSGGLWEIYTVTGTFTAWTEVPGNGYLAPGTGPAATSWGPGRIDVFVIGASGGMWHQWYDAGTWNSYEPLGGGLTSSPGAVSAFGGGVGELFVIARGGAPAYNLWAQIYLTPGPWSGWIGPLEGPP